MGYMFINCRNLTNLDLSSFDTSEVRNVSNMFGGCDKLERLNLSNWDFRTNSLNSFLASKSSLKEVNLTNANALQVTNMSSMFINCSNLIKVDLNGFRMSMSSSNDMNSMFAGCSNLTMVPGIESLDLSGNLGSMFSNCNKLTATIKIRAPFVSSYSGIFSGAATVSGAQIIVNYSSSTSDLVDQMITNKSSNSNVVKGNLIS